MGGGDPAPARASPPPTVAPHERPRRALEVEGGIAHDPLNRPPDERPQRRDPGRPAPRPPRRGSAATSPAVIVYGGEKVFAAGADIKEMEAMSYTDMADHSGALQDFTRALARIPKPTVAAITGYALGGGCEVALALRLPRRRRRTPSSASPRSCSASSPAPAAPSAWPGSSGRPRPRTSSSPAGSSPPTRRSRSGSSTRWSRPQDVYAAARARLAPYVGGPAYALRAAKEAIDRGLEIDLESGPGDRADAVRRRCSPRRTAPSA